MDHGYRYNARPVLHEFYFMPELPEVEITRRSFAQAIAGGVITHAQMGKPLRKPLGLEPSALHGRKVLQVRRRGKYLLLDMDQGMLLIHLGMSGSLRFASLLPPAGVHDHFSLVTTQGTLRLNDPRRFGMVFFAHSEDAPEVQKMLGSLGVEPLSSAFEVQHFYHLIKARNTSIKQVLLQGRVVTGVGNIYASEALFHAGIRPGRRASSLTLGQVTRLHQSIIAVLERALSFGGSTLRNFSSASGQTGHFQLHVHVYGREGQACDVCNAHIKKQVHAQRSSFYCPFCQK